MTMNSARSMSRPHRAASRRRRPGGFRIWASIAAALVLAAAALVLDLTPFTPARPAQAAGASCTSGLYGVDTGGTLYSLATSGGTLTGTTSIATFTAPVAVSPLSFNALAVDAQGRFYAVERWALLPGGGGTPANNNTAGGSWEVTVVRFDPATGATTTLGPSSTVVESNSTVAGAVDLGSGRYYFGTLDSTHTPAPQLVIRAWNPATNAVTVVTRLDLSAQFPGVATSAINGDFAFDSAGNLLVEMSSTSTSVLYTVAAGTLTSAAGTVKVPDSVVTLSNPTGATYNGIALGVSYAFGSTSTSLVTFDPNNFTPTSGPTTFGATTTMSDLAACTTPNTITLQKDIVARAQSGDQFHLDVSRSDMSGTSLGSNTTTGSTTGVQSGTAVLPVPAVAGKTYVLTETGAGGARLADYTDTITCADRANASNVVSATRTAAGTYSVVFPSGPQLDLVCTIHNKPTPGTYALAKTSSPASGTTVKTGDVITYTVTATGSARPDDGVIIADNLADVLDDASFVSGSAKLAIGSAAPIAVADPSGTTLSSGAFTLPANTTATLTYQVKVTTTAANRQLKNVVTGTDGGGNPPTSCTCTTTHVTPNAYDVYLKKTSTDGTPLAGSQWTLQAGTPGSPGTAVTTSVAPTAQTGQFVMAGLAPGDYLLTETKAPQGYELLAQQIAFTVSSTGTVSLTGAATPQAKLSTTGSGATEIDVADAPAIALPYAGGPGNGGLVAAGLVLVLLAGVQARRS